MARGIRFLIDEDLPPRIAEIARALGLDAVAVQEIGRRGLSDDEHLRWAAGEGRIVVTRNRDDFIEWTTVFFQTGEPHAGVLLVSTPHSVQGPERLAHAVRDWVDGLPEHLREHGVPAYYIDFLALP